MMKAYLLQPLITKLEVYLLRDVGLRFDILSEIWLTLLELHPQYPQYKWFPEVLTNATHSSEHLARLLNSRIGEGSQGDDLKLYATELVRSGLGIQDSSDDEIQSLLDQPLLSVYTFADMISRRAVSFVWILWLILFSPVRGKNLGLVFLLRTAEPSAITTRFTPDASDFFPGLLDVTSLT
jgi:hypothetical protein